MDKHSLFFFILLSLSGTAFAQKNMVSVGYSFGLNVGGSVQVREGGTLGDSIELKEDLGLKNVPGLDLTYGFRIGDDWLDVGYTKFFLKGGSTFYQTTKFNGAVYSPGDVKIDKSDYRRYMLIFKRTISGNRQSLEYAAWGLGLIVETLKFYIDGNLDPSSTRFEKFEAFDRQMYPAPTVTFSYSRPWNENWGYNFDILLAALPKTKTFYLEGGNIIFEQYNVDLKADLNFLNGSNLYSFGYFYKQFRQKEFSNEDTNEFSIFTNGLVVQWKYFF